MDEQNKATSTNRRFSKRKILRQATLILPSTGERVRRDVTLRDPELFNSNATAENGSTHANDERAPLLPKAIVKSAPAPLQRASQWIRELSIQAWEASKTDNAHNILKCSLAYFIATLATFFIPVANLLGTHQDGNQLVANIVVWFDPARSAGSMELGVIFAFLAFLYGAVVAFGGQATSVFFTFHEIPIVGHILVLLVFCWGGLGALAWFKQHVGHPLVNTASSLASLAIVTCITKEGSVQAGDFSYYRIGQVLKMLIMGVLISSLVNLLIWPISARKRLLNTLMETTDAFGELLATVAVCFLTGSDEDLAHPNVIAADEKFKTNFNSLSSHLAESRYEHHLLGTEQQYHIEKRMVDCVQRLAQDLGGLRSAAATQFSLLAEDPQKSSADIAKPSASALGSVASASSVNAPLTIDTIAQPMAKPATSNQTTSNTAAATSTEQVQSPTQIEDSFGELLHRTMSVQTPAHIFDTFISHLGPPMRSMAWTMKEILKALPIASAPDRDHGRIPKFRNSLKDAIHLFNKARKEALEAVYKTKGVSQLRSLHVAADFEEVAASCGHFSSSLEDFAENCMKYLDVLDQLELEIHERPNGRTWYWLLFWRHNRDTFNDILPRAIAHEEAAMTKDTNDIPTLRQARQAEQDKYSASLKFPYWLYPYFRPFRREDVKFALKVGGGATLYAMFAFIPATEPYFQHWHLEWSLVSYMLVCSMNLGASNTTAWSRSYGTLFGALIAIVVWIICRKNPFALAFCGWLVSLMCFYFIVAKGRGPMGRFILLTYNLSVLYSFALSIGDPEADKDEIGAGIDPQIFDIAYHRFVAVILGVIGGLVVTYYIWPISAREKCKTGLSRIWLRMSLMWKRAPLQILIEGAPVVPAYMDIRTETALREYTDTLDALRTSAQSEFKLKGPFPADSFDTLLKSTVRMLDSFHALNVVISKELKASAGENEILHYTASERDQLALRISHMLSVLAASLSMEYPLIDALPSTTHVRDRLLAKVFEFRQNDKKKTTPSDDDYELLYCYALVTASIAKEIEISGRELEKLYTNLGEKVLKLQ